MKKTHNATSCFKNNPIMGPEGQAVTWKISLSMTNVQGDGFKRCRGRTLKIKIKKIDETDFLKDLNSSKNSRFSSMFWGFICQELRIMNVYKF